MTATDRTSNSWRGCTPTTSPTSRTSPPARRSRSASTGIRSTTSGRCSRRTPRSRFASASTTHRGRAAVAVEIGVATTRERPALRVDAPRRGGHVAVGDDRSDRARHAARRARRARLDRPRRTGGHPTPAWSCFAAPPPSARAAEPIEPATALPAPEEIASADELYLAGVHLAQYRHATRSPEPYWEELLRRDPLDSRGNVALGERRLRAGRLDDAERHLRAAIARETRRNPNPASGEAHYLLGFALQATGRPEAAYDAYAKSMWNAAWRVPAHLALARLDATAGRWTAGAGACGSGAAARLRAVAGHRDRGHRIAAARAGGRRRTS